MMKKLEIPEIKLRNNRTLVREPDSNNIPVTNDLERMSLWSDFQEQLATNNPIEFDDKLWDEAVAQLQQRKNLADAEEIFPSFEYTDTSTNIQDIDFRVAISESNTILNNMINQIILFNKNRSISIEQFNDYKETIDLLREELFEALNSKHEENTSLALEKIRKVKANISNLEDKFYEISINCNNLGKDILIIKDSQELIKQELINLKKEPIIYLYPQFYDWILWIKNTSVTVLACSCICLFIYKVGPLLFKLIKADAGEPPEPPPGSISIIDDNKLWEKFMKWFLQMVQDNINKGEILVTTGEETVKKLFMLKK